MQRVEDTLGVPRQLTDRRAGRGPLTGPPVTDRRALTDRQLLTDHRLLDAAVRYAQERRWEVLAGSWLEADPDGTPRCSCGAAGCPVPGAHPAGPDWATQASGNAAAVRRMWQRQPRASILLPTGRSFDAIDVSESAGLHALARMERLELPLGPVIAAPTRRLVFFVLPGSAVKAADMLTRTGRRPAALGLAVRGEGDWVIAPPTRMGGGGVGQWAREPTTLNRWLPDAEELLAPLAYACGQEAAQARGRKAVKAPALSRAVR